MLLKRPQEQIWITCPSGASGRPHGPRTERADPAAHRDRSLHRRRPVHDNLEVHPRKVFGIGLILTSMIGRYRQRSILALVLMVAQSFLYNSVFFTFGLIL